jgi:hypothetical protein
MSPEFNCPICGSSIVIDDIDYEYGSFNEHMVERCHTCHATIAVMVNVSVVVDFGTPKVISEPDDEYKLVNQYFESTAEPYSVHPWRLSEISVPYIALLGDNAFGSWWYARRTICNGSLLFVAESLHPITVSQTIPDWDTPISVLMDRAAQYKNTQKLALVSRITGGYHNPSTERLEDVALLVGDYKFCPVRAMYLDFILREWPNAAFTMFSTDDSVAVWHQDNCVALVAGISLNGDAWLKNAAETAMRYFWRAA